MRISSLHTFKNLEKLRNHRSKRKYSNSGSFSFSLVSTYVSTLLYKRMSLYTESLGHRVPINMKINDKFNNYIPAQMWT